MRFLPVTKKGTRTNAQNIRLSKGLVFALVWIVEISHELEIWSI